MSLSGVWSWFKRWRAKRDEEKYHQWCAFVQTKEFGADIFQIVSVRQKARTGLKAYVRWLGSGQTCAVWSEGAWPSTGMFVSAMGNYSHGAHHNEEVFYVNKLFGFIDGKYYAAMRRHIARANAAS